MDLEKAKAKELNRTKMLLSPLKQMNELKNEN